MTSYLNQKNMRGYQDVISRLVGLPEDSLDMMTQTILRVYPETAANKTQQTEIFYNAALKASIYEGKKGKFESVAELLEKMIEQIEAGKDQPKYLGSER